MPLESIQYLESYDAEELKKFVLCLDVQGRPFFKILEGLPEETVTSLMSIMDMIVDNTMGGDLNEAYILKKGIRCYEELYRLFRRDEFLEELAKLARTHGFTLEDDDRVPSLTEDGGIIKYFKFHDTKYYTPDFERDQEIYQPKIDTITNHIHSCVADYSPIRIDGVVPQWGEPRTGKYERGLEGLRIKFAFRDRTATKAKNEQTPPAS